MKYLFLLLGFITVAGCESSHLFLNQLSYRKIERIPSSTDLADEVPTNSIVSDEAKKEFLLAVPRNNATHSVSEVAWTGEKIPAMQSVVPSFSNNSERKLATMGSSDPCDTLVLQNGEIILARNIEVGRYSVKYTTCEDGKFREIPRDYVFKQIAGNKSESQAIQVREQALFVYSAVTFGTSALAALFALYLYIVPELLALPIALTGSLALVALFPLLAYFSNKKLKKGLALAIAAFVIPLSVFILGLTLIVYFL